MSERIKLIADDIWAEEYWDKPNTDKLLPAQLNRFALLIVQGNIQTLRSHGYDDAAQVLQDIHFGIEDPV